MAAASEVQIEYILSDVLQLPDELLSGKFDVVYMEHGILHYFLDLIPLFRVVQTLLRPGGKLVLQDFHSVTTKLLLSRGSTANIRMHKLTGDYFDTSLEGKEVSFSKFLPDGNDANVPNVSLRNWKLSEIITSVASQGLYIKVLEELPNLSSEKFDKESPKPLPFLSRKFITFNDNL